MKPLIRSIQRNWVTRMKFPLWHYLNQPLWHQAYPVVLNPREYWYRHNIRYLNRCLNGTFLEQCWHTNYQDFIKHYRAFCDRNVLEEDPVWLLERCWCLKKRNYHSIHPLEAES